MMLLHKIKIAAVFILLCAISVTRSQDTCRDRNVAQAKAEDPTRECKKECETDADCTSPGGKKTCNCDNLCGLSCFNLEAECPDLTGTLENGVVTTPKGLAYGAVAKYSCNKGYYRKGVEKRTCRSDRLWSQAKPNCTRGCEIPGPHANGVAITDKLGFDPGDTVTYICKSGFKPRGTMTITCQGDYLWTPVRFICEKKDCGTPPSISHGGHTGTNYLFGGTVRVVCDTGYELEGREIQRCMTEGIWKPGHPWGKCIPKTCPAPAQIENGKVDLSRAPDLEYDQRALYSCDLGYRLEGPDEGRCDENGTWGIMPKCFVDISCNFEKYAESTCGYNITLGNFVRQQTDSNIDDLPGYTLFGQGRIRSMPYKLEGSKELCIGVNYKSTKKRELMAYAYNGEDTLPLWFSPESIGWASGKFKLKKVKSADTKVQLEFEAIGHVELDDIEVLEDNECIDIPAYCLRQTIEHGKISPSAELYTEGDKITFSCNEGYKRKGPEEAKCETDETWSDVPECVELAKCQKMELGNGTVSPDKAIYTENDEIRYSCKDGFNMKGRNKDVCGPDGTWTGAPECEKAPTTTTEAPTTTSKSTKVITSGTPPTTTTVTLETPLTTTTTTNNNNNAGDGRAKKPGSDEEGKSYSTSAPGSTPSSQLSSWAIVLIVIAVVIITLLVVFLVFRVMKKEKINGYTSATPANPVASDATPPKATAEQPVPTTTV